MAADSVASAEDYFASVYPRGGLLTDIKVTIPLDSFNGTAILREPAAHAVVLRFDLAERTSRAEVIRGLTDLSKLIVAFLAGRGQGSYGGYRTPKLRDDATAAVLGFGPGFFTRSDFDSRSVPEIAGDEGQSDLYLSLEAANRSLMLEATVRIKAYARASGWLTFLDAVEGVAQDGRNVLGFPRNFNTATIETTPGAEDVTFLRATDQARSLAGGTYITHLHYAADIEQWRDAQDADRERISGFATGTLLQPLPRTSYASAWSGAPRFVRRETDSFGLDAQGRIARGVLQQVFHRFPRAFAEFRDRRLEALELVRSGTLSLVSAGTYYVPPTEYTAYPGQELFEPELLSAFFEGLTAFFDARYGDALRAWQRTTDMAPRFFWAFICRSECYHDLMRLDDARRALEQAAEIDPNSHIYLEQMGWQSFLEGEYETTVRFSRRAVTAYYNDSYRSYPLHDLGAALLELGRAAEAEVELRAAAARVNLVVKNCYSLGNALDAQGKDAEANKIYDRTVEVAEYLLRRGRFTRRDLRTEFDTVFIPYRSPRSETTRERIRRLVRAARA